MSNPVIITIEAQTADAAAALKAFAAQGAQNLSVLKTSVADLGKAADGAGTHIAGMSYYFRSAMDTVRLAAMGGGDRAAFYAVDELTRALVASGAAMSTLLPIGVGLAAAIGAGVYVWREWTEGEREAAEQAKNLAEAWKALPDLIKQIQAMQNVGLLGPGAAGEFADYLTGRKKLYKDAAGNITPQPSSTVGVNSPEGQSFLSTQPFSQIASLEQNANTPGATVTIPNKAMDATKDHADIQKWVQDQITAGGQVTKEQLEALGQLHEEIQKINQESLQGIEKQKAEVVARYDAERQKLQELFQLSGAQLGNVNFSGSRDVIATQSAMAKTYKDQQQDIAALEQKNADELTRKKQEALDKVVRAMQEEIRTGDEYARKQEESDKQHTEQILRQEEIQRQISRDNLEAQLKGVSGNPLLSSSQKAAESIPILQQIMAANREGIVEMTAEQEKLDRSSETYWLLQEKIAKSLREQAELQNQMAAASPFAKLQAQVMQMAGAFQSWKDATASIGQVGLNSIQTGMSSVATNMTKVIEGTEKWKKALTNIAESVITQLLEGLIQVVEKLLVQLAIDIAIKAVTGGAFAEGGRPDVGKVALVGERGPELFVPDSAGTIIPAHQTASILQGRGDAGGFAPQKMPGNTNNFHFWDARPSPSEYLNSSAGTNHIIQIVRGNRQAIGIQT